MWLVIEVRTYAPNQNGQITLLNIMVTIFATDHEKTVHHPLLDNDIDILLKGYCYLS